MPDQIASGSLPEDHPLYAPGIKRRARVSGSARYWMAPVKAAAAGFHIKSVTFPADLTEEEVAERCRRYWIDLAAWRAGTPTATRYTFGWLIDRYVSDEFSPFQRIGHKSRRNYRKDCENIREVLADVLLDRTGKRPLIGEDAWRWHKAFGLPADDGKPTAPSRARHAITMLRILVNYARTIGVPTARDFADVLKAMKFPTTAARTVAPTFDHVAAIVKQAIAEGYRSIAIATLAQFEFTERRISIIGAWEESAWRCGWVWSGISGKTRVGISADWMITYTQNKVGEVVREYDLKAAPLLLQLLQQTPEAERSGPVIVCETTGLPWREKHYTDTFRQLARAAGVPDEICSMDMRAGGATETDAIPGVTERHMKDAGGWSSDVFNRYRRDKQRNAQNVVVLRQQARGGNNG